MLIHKQALDYWHVIVNLPADSEVISVLVQNEQIVFYYKFDEENQYTTESWEIVAVGTGNKFPNDLGEFVGTVQIGAYMQHVFARKAQLPRKGNDNA